MRVEYLRAWEDHTWDTTTVEVPLADLVDLKVTEAGDDEETLQRWAGHHLRDLPAHRKVVVWGVYMIHPDDDGPTGWEEG